MKSLATPQPTSAVVAHQGLQVQRCLGNEACQQGTSAAYPFILILNSYKILHPEQSPVSLFIIYSRQPYSLFNPIPVRMSTM